MLLTIWSPCHPISASDDRDERDRTSSLQRGLMTQNEETLSYSGSITILCVNECKYCMYYMLM